MCAYYKRRAEEMRAHGRHTDNQRYADKLENLRSEMDAGTSSRLTRPGPTGP